MKHNPFSVLSALFMSIFVGVIVSGCGDVGSISSSEDARAQQAKESKALEDLYSAVQGVWEGTVSNTSTGLRAFKGELSIYTYYIQDGSNSDGSPRLRPTLRGRFRPADFTTATDNIILVGDYDRSGRLIMASQSLGTVGSGSSGGVPSVLSLRGSVAQGKLNLEISQQGGVWGFFEAVRTKSFASAPVAGENAQDRERFEKIYGPIEGRYMGRMKSVNGNDYMVEVAIVIVEGEFESGKLGPMLMARYERLDAGAGAGFEASMGVTYNAQTGEIYMRNAAGSSGLGTLSVSGVLVTVQGQKILRVKVRNKAAVLGDLEAVRN